MINKHNSTNLYWKKYNLEKDKLIKKIINFNRKSNINYFENGHFNHTRDLFALSLAYLKNKKNNNILDYGSNLLTLCNLNNKIDVRKFKFTIYDPFYEPKEKIKIKDVNYQIINNENRIFKNNYDLLHFASSGQYQKNFLSKIQDLNLNKAQIILFTHTPFSLDRSYSSIQSNHNNLTQHVHSYKLLISILKKKNFNLIFKSRNDDKYIACKKKKYKTYSLNLIFNK